MKKISVFLLVLSIYAPAQEVFHFVVAPSSEHARVLEPTLSNLLFSDMAEGDVLTVTHALTHEDIMSIQLPAKVASRPIPIRKKMIAKLFARDLSKLRRFLVGISASTADSAHPESSHQESSQPAHLLRFLDTMESRKALHPNHTHKVVWMANPVVHDENALFTMDDSRFPSDAHLFSSESIYSTLHRKSLLKNVELHIVHSSNKREFGPESVDLHHQKLKRFWALYVSHAGGKLATFGGSSHHLQNLKHAPFPGLKFQPDRSDTKLQSFQYQKQERQRTEVIRQQQLFQVMSSNPEAPSRETRSPLEVGITWKGHGIDLDVYTQIESDEQLSFRKQSSEKFGGKFFKDIRSAPGTNGFETIAYSKPLSLHQVEPILINHYSGSSASRIEGEIRVKFAGKVYFKKFSISPGSGTQGARSSRHDPAWVEIDIAGVVGGVERSSRF